MTSCRPCSPRSWLASAGCPSSRTAHVVDATCRARRACPCRIVFVGIASRCGRLGCRRLKEPPQNPEKIAERKGCTKSHMRRNETPYPTCMKFCNVVCIPDVINCTDFGDNQLRGFCVVGSKFPIPHRLLVPILMGVD